MPSKPSKQGVVGRGLYRASSPQALGTSPTTDAVTALPQPRKNTTLKTAANGLPIDEMSMVARLFQGPPSSAGFFPTWHQFRLRALGFKAAWQFTASARLRYKAHAKDHVSDSRPVLTTA